LSDRLIVLLTPPLQLGMALRQDAVRSAVGLPTMKDLGEVRLQALPCIAWLLH